MDDLKTCTMVDEKRVAVPNPPPMPCLPTTTNQKKMLAKAMGVFKNRTSSSIKCNNIDHVNNATRDLWERLFDRAYRADVVVVTDYGGQIYAHACVLGMVSPVIRHMLKKSKTKNGRRSIRINGVPHDAVRAFIKFFYSSSYEGEEMKEYVLQLLVLSHVFAVPHLKEVCQARLENDWLDVENVVDVFQLALLCDTPRLTFICHRMILSNFQAVTATQGWRVMKEGHPALEKDILETVVDAETRENDRIRKKNEKNMYVQLYDAMEALVHICRDGCKTIGPHDKAPKEDNEAPCEYTACKGLELLLRHFAACKLRVPGGCPHCKRMWQLLELHSRLCADSDLCGVPLCSNFKEKSVKQNRKEEMRWKTLAKKILRSKIIYGRSPFFSLAAC